MGRHNIPLRVEILLADVAQPTVAAQGTGGSETWGYGIVGVKANGTEAAVSTEGQEAGGNAALDATDFNRITWTDVAGYVSYKIYRLTSGGTPATLGLIGTVAAGVETFDDTGLVGDASTASAANATGDGDAANLSPFTGTCLGILQGTFTGTWEMQSSQDGSVWTKEGADLAAAGDRDITYDKRWLRLVNTAYTSGTPVGFVAGSD